jgi:signal transduction histidine kinase/putative methionine-R-sulfoxide reductase with GAF domain
VLETIGNAAGFDVGCYWPVDVDEPRRTWARPEVHAEGFLAMTERASFAPPLVPGVVAQSREAVWLDVLEPERVPRASVALAEGLKSGAALPVEVEGELMGVLEIYSSTARGRDDALLETLVGLGRQMAQFLRRKRAEVERGESLQRERQARAEAESAVATLRKLGRVSEAALEHLSLDDLLPALLERIVEVLEADTATILLTGDDGQLHVRAAVGIDEEVATRSVAIPLGAGMAGRVAATRVPLLVPDLAAAESVSPVLQERGVNSLVAIPLVAEDRVIGVVHAGSEAYAQFTEDDARLLELIADRIALAIEHAALTDAERRAQERLRFLADASTILSSSLDVDRTLQQLGALLAERVADWCVIHLLGDDGRVTVGVIAHREPERVRRAWADAADLPRDREPPSSVTQALLTGEPQVFADPAALPPDAPERAQGVHTGIVAPLVARGRALGTITIVRDETEGAYGDADVEFAADLARRASIALDNARLFHDAERARDRVGFLAEASGLLGSSLDLDRTLEQLGSLVVARAADWCVIHLVEETGARVVALAHRDAAKAAAARDVVSRLEYDPAARSGVPHVIRTGDSELHPVLSEDQLRGEARALGLHSGLIVPLVARGRTLGAMSWALAESEGSYDERDLALAHDLASRAASAIDNARLYRQAEERAQAVRVLASVGDGVFLVDRGGIVRTWNRAAAAVTGLRTRDVIDRPAVDAIPGWVAVAAHVPVAQLGTTSVRAESLPLDLGDRELWLSVHGVAVPDGIVYAFRDLTEERALETMRTEFVSTVSHELRTPLAAIYGAAMTLRRSDVALDESQRARLLDVVSGEADRLARTVNDILWASRLDTGSLHVTISSCDPYALASDVVEAQRAHLDEQHAIELDAVEGLPPIAGDPDKVGRVLINLVDNAVKYSPDGGTVRLRVRQVGGRVRFSVTDDGLGIPPGEQRRIFEKFYRLDPNMTRGVGGTGLGLYLCRELVRRMDGRIWVESRGLGSGSTFHVELPVAGDFVAHIA